MSPEDTNGITLLDPLCTDDAYQRVVAFARRFGEPHTILAMHAALPLGLTPEIVHLIRINFVRDADWIAEADLLLSPLCREVGGDLYEMYPDVREFLLDELRFDQEFGPFRVVRIAEFLLAYAERAIKLTKSPDMLDFLRAQQWVALAYADPKDAAESLALALDEGLKSANRDETIRIASLTQVLATPLIAEEKVLLYAAGVEKLAAGDRSGASRLLEAVGPTDQSPRIGDVSLPSPDEVMQMLGPSLATPEAAAPLVLYPNLNCPSQIIINQKFRLFVQLLSEPPEEGIEAIHIKDTGVHEHLPEVEVELRVSGFNVEGSNTKVLRVQRDDISQEEFVLIPHQRDEQQIQVEFYQHSQLIGTARHSVSIVAKTTSIVAKTTQSQFDVFLCHNSEDKEAVIKIAEQLKDEYKIEPWLDVWELRPGLPWQAELEKQIAHIKSAAVFVGKSGIAPWQSQEIYGFLREFQERQCPVIPVLLPDAPQKPQLPIFLRRMTWVDFREQTRVYTPAMDRLVWGITGIKPKTRVKVIPRSQSDNLSYEPRKEVLTTQKRRNLEVIETQKTLQNERDDSGDDLSSETDVDYRQLRDLLKAQKWKEADQETLAVMLKATGRENERFLDTESIENFPCTDLRTIDQLWVKYSGGRFGFSVQKRIWESVGGNPNADIETWDKFGDRVGWLVKRWFGKKKLLHKDLSFNINAPLGHLPSHIDVVNFDSLGGSLFSRVQTCQL